MTTQPEPGASVDRTVVSVPLHYSNHSGARSVLLDVPHGTPRSALDAAALTYQRSRRGPGAGNPALWRLSHRDVHDFAIDPATFTQTGRTRLMGRPTRIEDVADLLTIEYDRLSEIAGSTLYEHDVRERARKAMTELDARHSDALDDAISGAQS